MKLTGSGADAPRERATNMEVFLTAEGGMKWSAMVDGKPVISNSDAFASEVGRPDLAATVEVFETVRDRAASLNKSGLCDAIHGRGFAMDGSGFGPESDVFNKSGALLLSAARQWLEKLADESIGLETLAERHLEAGLLEEVSVHRDAQKQVHLKRTAERPAVLEGWPGVGSLDLEFASKDGPVWAELKWAKSADYLFNCLWDTAKLARAVRNGVASAGYLVAGAPVSEWEKRVDYAEVFNFSGFDGASVTNLTPRFAACWDGWRRKNRETYPEELPCPVCTWPEGEVRSENVAGREPWAIRVARVTAPGSSTVKTPHDVPVVAEPQPPETRPQP